ncbi:MAG: Smr/MutS family endonuclease [Gammaproteobacteria bacterium]|nr:Smr/MutS family endonuclease [Gammaproteobacteria bacterium]MDX5375535.1 Smr/MutS family endonuclease [Gammaproteobacteria bacterium]
MTDHDDNPDDGDIHLFRQLMGEVAPLRHDKVEPPPSRPAPRPAQFLADEARVLEDMLSDDYDPSELQPGDMLAFCRPGLKKTHYRKLRRGEYAQTAELDLHGMTVPLAREALVTFLDECRRLDARCVRVIHGKGLRSSNQGPVLKIMVNRWLRQRDEVLAFCSARPVDGGTGAVYVLLRRWRGTGD